MTDDLVRTTLSVLPKDRLKELSRTLGLVVPESLTKDEQVRRIANTRTFVFRNALQNLTRDELREACRAAGLDDSPRARIELARQLLADYEHISSLDSEASEAFAPSDAPLPSEVVLCRQRQYLVESTYTPPSTPETPHPMTQVNLVCMDDDAAGRPLEVLWELELGARVIRTHEHGLGKIQSFDPPNFFSAYVSALRWNCVTATDAQLFQAPFRAGIKLFNHQLTPLQKALSLPRANLFIADDVGLGKTIEAGLILQELILRQRIDFTLIACPASVVLQWRDEMSKKFGLHFEIYNRDFIGQRRRERGFRVNPWSTHTRFIVSHNMLTRPEHRDPLLQFLGEHVRKSLLILDEAHAAAPASASKYAVDSRFTKVIRDVAPRFENRIFLSATPHNGHSNSFAALLEILDPQRFMRGVPVTSEKQLEPVMVRRLKSDLRKAGLSFPKRVLVKLELQHDGTHWGLTQTPSDSGFAKLGAAPPDEIELAEMLASYTELMNPRTPRAKFVFVNLQKRLLSSPEAFWRTLQAHSKSKVARELSNQIRLDDELYGSDDDELEESLDDEIRSRSQDLDLGQAAQRLRDQMDNISDRLRYRPDAKMLALRHWIETNLKTDGKWNGRKLLIFTEYGDTKRYVVGQLRDVFGDAAERIMQFHGAMSDDEREIVQRAFNDTAHPVRILVATDAAREGVNLQGACADLLHYDIPWNPSKMEQRNGRIDRTLQPSDEVRCMYFSFPQRTEDRVLEVVLQKIETIQEELGSLSAVLLDDVERALENGINANTLQAMNAVKNNQAMVETRRRELETQRSVDRVKKDVDSAGKILDRSRKILNFNIAHFQKTVDVACRLTTGSGLVEEADGVYSLPPFPSSWQATFDTMRPPRERDEDDETWRSRPLFPVVFHAPNQLNAPLVHLHLEHPFVQRLFSRFRAQGYAAHDLSRVTVVANPDASTVRAVAIARLSLFGAGATRLHDELICVSAPWYESADPNHLVPDDHQPTAAEFIDQILLTANDDFEPSEVHMHLLRNAADDFAKLWSAIEADAEARAHDAQLALTRRGKEEADALTKILENQRAAIEREINQIPLFSAEIDNEQKRQRDADVAAMTDRYKDIDHEIATQPLELNDLFAVRLKRLEPVGFVYLWPTTRSV